MRALIARQSAEVEVLRTLMRQDHSVAILVVVRCRRCGEKVADVRDYFVGHDHEVSEAIVGNEPLGAAVLMHVEPADPERVRHLKDERMVSAREVLVDEVWLLLERTTAADAPRILPVWCSHHGPVAASLGSVAKALAKARTADSMVTLRA